MLLVRHGQSEFNVHYNRTGIDPGIRDPGLTEEGRAQAERAAATLAPHAPERIIASPYRRTIETASIIADQLGLPITVDPLIGEWARFSCDVGSPSTELKSLWPALAFDHLPDAWWPEPDESEIAIRARCAAFRAATDAHHARDRIVAVTHWGFILHLTGVPVPNGTVVRFDLAPEPRAAIVEPATSMLPARASKTGR